MKKLRLFACMLIVLVSGMLVVTAVSAQAGVTATPSQLTIAGVRNTVETRTLLLRATDPITGLHVIPLDLARADGDAVLSAGAIRVTLPADQVTADAPLTLPVQVNLHGAPSGEFSGELLVNYHGGSLAVPVTVTVKDPLVLPLVVLVAGVVLGVGVSNYRAGGRSRDEILVRVEQLRVQMRADTKLAEPFRERIEAYLIDVGAALQTQKWEDAQGAVEQAQGIWLKWRKGRDDWLAQLDYHAELVEQMASLPSDVFYLRVMRRGLKKAADDTVNLKDADDLRDQLDLIVDKLNRYLKVQAGIEQLNVLRNRLPADEAEPWRLKTLDFGRRLGELDPDADGAAEACQTLTDEVGKAVDELVESASQRGELEFAVEGRAADAAMLGLLLPAPSIRRPGEPSPGTETRGCSRLFTLLFAPSPSPTMEDQMAGARTRLRTFTWASYVIAVVLLAGAGFGELYVTNVTFGANAWGDYFALLAWGFGAEATRAAVTDMVRNWGMPGLS